MSITIKARPRAATKAKNPAPTPKSVARPVIDEGRFEAILAGSPSPFSDAVLPNAFRETPDVPSIHAVARERCLELVNEARQSRRTSLQVITGDAGEGKTHLIGWLRRQSEEGWRKGTGSGRFALTVVPPLRSLGRARHHVLQEVVRQLSIRLAGNVHVDEATDTPIEILLWRALLAISKLLLEHRSTPPELRARLEEATSDNYDKYLSLCVEQLKHAWKLIGRSFVDTALRLPELADVDREVFRVVARFPEGDEAERTAIVDWLGGASLSTERLESLGTSLVLDEEAEATRGLKTLLTLARFAGTPVALAFDQIEGTVRLGPDAVTSFLDAITELYNECPATVLLVFCQTHLWPSLRDGAPSQVRDRLDDTPPVHLKALTTDEAVLLVETRMRRFWDGVADRPENAFFPLTREQVLAHVKRQNLRTPRAVVRYFHGLLRQPPELRPDFVAPAPPPPDELVRRKLDALLEEESRTARPPDTRAPLVQSVARDLLLHAVTTRRAIAGVVVEEVNAFRARKTSAEGVRVTLARGASRKSIYLESSNSQHGKSASSTVKRMAEVLATKQADTALLLREEAFPLPPAARKALVEISPQGAVLRLAEGEVAPLAAIEALLNAAAAGDVPVDRATALDIAVRHLESNLGLTSRIVEMAFPNADDPPSTDPEPLGPTSANPVDLDARMTKVLEHLRNERAFEPVAQLAGALGLTVEAVFGVLQELASRELVDIVTDRNRAPIVLLRPEAV